MALRSRTGSAPQIASASASAGTVRPSRWASSATNRRCRSPATSTTDAGAERTTSEPKISTCTRFSMEAPARRQRAPGRPRRTARRHLGSTRLAGDSLRTIGSPHHTVADVEGAGVEAHVRARAVRLRRRSWCERAGPARIPTEEDTHTRVAENDKRPVHARGVDVLDRTTERTTGFEPTTLTLARRWEPSAQSPPVR